MGPPFCYALSFRRKAKGLACHENDPTRSALSRFCGVDPAICMSGCSMVRAARMALERSGNWLGLCRTDHQLLGRNVVGTCCWRTRRGTSRAAMVVGSGRYAEPARTGDVSALGIRCDLARTIALPSGRGDSVEPSGRRQTGYHKACMVDGVANSVVTGAWRRNDTVGDCSLIATPTDLASVQGG